MAKSHSKKCTDEKQWDHRRRNTISTIYAHGCEMHGSNTPGNPDEILLLKEPKKFMYDIFLTILQIPMGIHFVHSYEASHKAQAI